MTHEDKEKIRWIVKNLDPIIKWKRERDIWRKMLQKNPDELWVRYIIGQFCVTRGIRNWENLKKCKDNWLTFHRKMRLGVLIEQSDVSNYILGVFEEFKPTIYWKKIAKKIANFVQKPNIVKNGKLILFDNLEGLNENQKREKLLERTRGFFNMKSVSDLMIEVGMAKDLIAFDTRIVGFLVDYLLEPGTLSAKEDNGSKLIGKVQSSPMLYKKMEQELRKVCKEIRIPLSKLDRIIFNSYDIPVIQYILEKDGYIKS